MKILLLLAGLLILAPLSAQTFALKYFPPEAEVLDGGTVLKPVKTAEFVKTFALTETRQWVLQAPGYQPLTLTVTPQAQAEPLEVKLEKAGGLLTRVAEARTGIQPKSVTWSADGRYLLVPLLADTGIDVFTAKPLALYKRLTPPGYGAKHGFVETGWLPALQEYWFSQMTTGMIHIYDAQFHYKESFSTGGLWSKVIAFSPDGRTALVSNWESNSVTVFDTASRTLRGKVKTPGIPRGLAFSEDGRRFYCAIFDNGQVVHFATADLKPLTGLDFGSGSAMRHALVSGGKLLVSDMAGGRVLFADEATGKTEAAVKLGYNINTIALSPDGRWLFASSRGKNNPVNYEHKGPDFGKIYWIDTKTRQVAGWIWGRNQPTGLAVSPDGTQVAFTDFLDANLELYQLNAR